MAEHRPAPANPRPTRSRTVALALVVAVIAMALGTSAAQAATVYEITGEWEAGTPTTASKGDVVTAVWRVNVNDDQPAASNDPVDNVTFTTTLDHGLFKTLPDVCKTTGVDPPSSISADGLTLTCNLGTVVQGTAYVVQTPVVVDGLTGDQLTASGTIAGQTTDLPPINIQNTFGMDMLWGTPTSTVINAPGGDGGDVAFDFEWTLFQDAGSDPGPDTVSYNINVTLQNGQPVVLGQQTNTAPFDQPCTPFQNTRTAEGHPYSRGSTPDKRAPFVESCTLTQIAPGQFRLTLSGIDYSQVQVPTLDSAGNPLPTDQVAVASGSVWFRVNNLTSSTSANLRASAPTYTSTTGLTSVDDPTNNTSSKVITFPGTWSHAWVRTGGGTAWDNTFKVAPGTVVTSTTNDTIATTNVPNDTPVGDCDILDTRYVTYQSAAIHAWAPGDPIGDPEPAGFGRFQYYVGPAPADPNTSTICGQSAGWVNTEPADLTTVKAVRWVSTAGEIGNQNIALRVNQMVKTNVAIGQDIWTWGSVYRTSQGWFEPARDTDGTSEITPTPGDRYPYTTGARDILHVVFATPSIIKRSDRQVVRPGEPATFSLIYSANGTGTIPPTVDDYTITDTLPAGMTYVAGSATPEPTVTTNASGQQVLTWNLDDVPTNTRNTLTYQAVADDTVTPGQTLTNTAVSSLRGETSRPATAQVTVSSSGYTLIGKTADQVYIPNPTADGVGTGSWTVTLRSFDPLPQAFTDTIDILPYNGDARGTSFNGTYTLDSVTVPAGATVYYTDANPATLSDDPADPMNGAAGTTSGNTVGWTTTRPANVTAFRVMGPQLDPGATFQFQVFITTDGAEGGDVYVNRAQARAEHTELVMRTSDPTTMAHFYSAQLKKYVQDRNGVWHDANDVTDYPTYEVGEEAPYRIVVTNTGRGTLRNFTITDDTFPEGSFTIDELAAGDSQAHEFSITLDESHLGTVVNTACATVDTPHDAPAPEIPCDPAGIEVAKTGFDKKLVSATPNGDGTWTVVNDITVTREGLPGIYRLTDTLRYGAGTTVQSTAVVNSDPGGIDTNPGWNGTSDTEIVAAAAIDAGATHVYRTTVVATLDPQGATTESSDCALGGGESGTGFLNQAKLEIDDKTFEDQECPPFPVIRHEKELAGDPVRNSDGTWTIGYEIVVTNSGAAPGTYSLDDRLVYGAGITVESASVANAAPGGIATNAAWNGTTSTQVVDNQTLEAGASHTYTVTVRATAPDGISTAGRDCTLGGGEDGTGFRNESTLTTNGVQQHDDACATPAPPGPPGQLAKTGGNITDLTLAGFGFLLVGQVLLARRRRLTNST